MPSYRLINSGKIQRREYLTENRSPLFQGFPEPVFAQEQKLSYDNFLTEKLPQLLSFYFPAEFSNYNNKVKINIKGTKSQEPKIKKQIRGKEVKVEMNEEEARSNSLTWSYDISFLWEVVWDCEKMQFKLLNDDSGDLKDSIIQWIEASFKIGKFRCERKNFSSDELEALSVQSKKKLQELQSRKSEKALENIFWHLEHKIEALEKNRYQEWEIEEETTIKKGKKDENRSLKIVLEILEQEDDNVFFSFHCEQSQQIPFCSFPKINTYGNFIINGHDKVVIFQSIRAPAIYYLINKEGKKVEEIIPLKGPWISISYSEKKPRTVELKFLNSKLVVNFFEVLKNFFVSPELLKKIFQEEDLDLESYSIEKPKVKPDLGQIPPGSELVIPQFLFTKKNSYFEMGRLGRKKANQKMSLLSQVEGQVLAEVLRDQKNRIILKKNSLLDEKNLEVLASSIQEKKLLSIPIPHSTSELYCLKIKSPLNPQKIISVVGFGEGTSEEKTYFDLADLICAVSGYINLHHGLGQVEKEEDKDKLDNQIIRCIGDLLYSELDSKMGGFLQYVQSKYLDKISQFKKTDLLKIPHLEDFNKEVKKFFNSSALTQLQNQNNPLSEISYNRKLSVLGVGGFSSANTTLTTRNINPSFYGRYDLVETPEGQRVGLVHNLTMVARINSYGQAITPYYSVKKRVVLPGLVYLTSEEEKNKYITHCRIAIDEKNRILETKVLARYQEGFTWIPPEKLDYIDSSFYQLNSVTSAIIPFFHHNDATRMLMSTNMQRQAITLLKGQAPLVSSGIESSIFQGSSLLVKAQEEGKIEYVDSKQVIIKESNSKKEKVYELKPSVVTNKNTLVFSLPLVKKGEKVEKGQPIAGGDYEDNGELALGYNLRAAYLCWNGYNYEDAIIINERLIKEDILTSFYARKYTVVRYNTKNGPEIFNPPLPYLEKKKLSHLDEEGIVKVGSWVKGGEILIGKLTPDAKPPKKKVIEEKLPFQLLLEKLEKLLGREAGNYDNSSFYMPQEEEGIVYQVVKKDQQGAKKLSELESQEKQIKKQIKANKAKVTRGKKSFEKEQLVQQLKEILAKKAKIKELETLEIYVAQERKVQVGDKLTTRFGNKGVVAKIAPEVDMPFDEHGRTIDIVFNPLGIPTRMNIGQLLETLLASAAHQLNTKILFRPFNTPSVKTIKEIVKEAKIKNFGSQKLFDGRTGQAFHHEVYNGYVYVVKLNHMVVDKLHSRNIGPYSLIYQQPLKGRSQGGGQRVGEMEGWVLEAHGAAYNLMEMMSVKSDDIYKRRSGQKVLLFADREIDLRSSQSESFNILLQYLRAIGFDLQAEDYQERRVNFYEQFSKQIRKKIN